MISSYFGRTFAHPSDDGGVYYCRQIDAADGVTGFEGMVWFGQHMSADPDFANVFVGDGFFSTGVLDEAGMEIHRWHGRFIDVPKGRSCGADHLSLRTFWAPDVGGLGFIPERYRIKDTSVASDFRGTTWPIDFQSTGLWAQGFADGEVGIAPPVIPPGVESDTRVAIRADAGLGASPLDPAFEGGAVGDLTGVWHDDDGATYYVTDLHGTGEFVWYAEDVSARPYLVENSGAGLPESEATGWASVFVGQRAQSGIRGFFADVPRGARMLAGDLTALVETADRIRIRDRVGRLATTIERRRGGLRVVVSVPELHIVDRNESRDDPTLYLSFFKVDNSEPSFDARQVHLGTNVAGPTVALSPEQGSYSTVLAPRLDDLGRPDGTGTLVGVAVYAVERDDRQGSFRDERFSSWASMQRDGVSRAIRAGRTPGISELSGAARQILTRWSWTDTDDLLGGDAVVTTYAALASTGDETHSLTFSHDGIYEVTVQISATTRLTPGCR